MTKRIDPRIPQHIGRGTYLEFPAIKSPWDKMMSYKDSIHYVARYNSLVTAVIHQAFRILMPDYVERTKLMCDYSYADGYKMQGAKDENGRNISCNVTNVPPFCRGNFTAGLYADFGDESLNMCGRVNDFGSYRVEKELDECPWGIVGSDLCRQTIATLQGGSDALGDYLPEGGPHLEFSMVEAIGCGDRHCRVVAECRKKWPMPPRENWEGFGPIATEHLIQFTPEDECIKESMIFREETNYTYASGTNREEDATSGMFNTYCSPALWYILPAVDLAIERGFFTAEQFDFTLKCVCEAAGKAAFGDFFAREGLRQWLGVPKEIGDDDGRVLGGYIEMYLQTMKADYKIEAFNKDEVIYDIDRFGISFGRAKHADALVYYWYGMSKTLMNPQWSLWEENSPEGRLRIKIAKNIDKFC